MAGPRLETQRLGIPIFMNITELFSRVRYRLRTPETRSEAVVLGAIIVIFLVLFVGAARYARQEYRDGLRRHHLREIKFELERSFNTMNGFPLHPSGDLSWCGSTEDSEDWFFTAFLKRERRWANPVGTPSSSHGMFYRYCPTVLGGKTAKGKPLAAGFFLEAIMENAREDSHGFNTEYNIFERTVAENGQTLFRICGGTEPQCGTEHP